VQNGASTVTQTANPSSVTVTFTGINVSSFGDGTVTLTATSTDAAGNVSTARTAGVTKDTAAPAAPSASYVDNSNTTADDISGSAEANATISITETAPGSATYGGSANSSGSFTIPVSAVHGTTGHPVNVSYTITATDAAGNTSGATTVAFADSK